MKKKKTWLAILAVITIMTFSSCSKFDFQSIQKGKPYVGLYQGKDCAVVFDQTDEGTIKGRVYIDNGSIVVDPISFTCDLSKKGKGKLWVNGTEKKIKKAKTDKRLLKAKLNKEEIVFQLSENVPVYKPMYREALYDVVPETNSKYAEHVQGYWSSYPDTGEDFATIYIRNVKSLFSTKDLDLRMDVYCPKDTVRQTRRPLLLLIHGGAFYNGDKRALGYPEMGNYFAERGYVVASINYRLGFKPMAADVDRAGYRALQDAHAAVCYLIQHAEEYGIDTTCIFAAGSSAGAITALNLAFMTEDYRPEATKENGTSKLIFSIIKTFEKIKRKVFNIFGFNSTNKEDKYIQILKDLGLDSDLGPINFVSGPIDRPFHVKAVVNMWGAVHTLEMLTPNTDILSFHGDADQIVPYEYGCPFDNVLDPYWDKIFNSLPSFMDPISELAQEYISNGKSLNEWVFNPMHGSKAINDKVFLLHNSHSELHTCIGGGHSLHEREYGCLSDYFTDTIIPNMNRFLCESIVGGKLVQIKGQADESPWFLAVNTDKVSELHWLVDGGVVVRSEGSAKAKVMYFGDAPHHSLKLSGKYNNGVEFLEGMEGE